jgi:hypothetical protein
MLKSLTLSMSLVFALGLTGVSFAGHGCDTCGLASPQGTVAPSAQGYTETCDTCAPAKKHHFSMPKLSIPACLKPKPKMYTYEWVLKKKKVHGHAASSCDTCGTAVTPSAQYSSPQAMSAPQSYAAPQAMSMLPTSEMKPATPSGDMAPPAPAAPSVVPPAPPVPSAAQGSLLFLAPTGN